MRISLAGHLLLIASACVAPAQAQGQNCLDVANESHHQLLFQNQDARVFVLELPRLASTQSHCHSHPYLYVVTGKSQSSIIAEGHAAIGGDWDGPEARFVYPPVQHVIRNESINPYREIIVETLHQVDYNPSEGNYNGDLFPSIMDDAKPTWTVSFSRGPLAASKSQLAPGAELSISSTNHVLLAITDLELRKQGTGESSETLQLRAQEIRILPGGSAFKLTNAGQRPAKFIVVEF